LSIVDRPGGDGNIPSAHVHQRADDPHDSLVATTALVASPIVGSRKLRNSYFTPVVLILDDYLVFGVNANASIKTGKETAERIRRAQQSSPGSRTDGSPPSGYRLRRKVYASGSKRFGLSGD
jgi:tripartite-type tricarboxylate transporter receptor subunit TctC